MSVDFRVYTLYEGLIWGFLNNSEDEEKMDISPNRNGVDLVGQ